MGILRNAFETRCLCGQIIMNILKIVFGILTLIWATYFLILTVRNRLALCRLRLYLKQNYREEFAKLGAQWEFIYSKNTWFWLSASPLVVISLINAPDFGDEKIIKFKMGVKFINQQIKPLIFLGLPLLLLTLILFTI